MSELVPIVITLGSVIVSLVAVIVWAVRFLTTRLIKAFDGLKEELHGNTQALRDMETQQKVTNTLVVELAKGE